MNCGTIIDAPAGETDAAATAAAAWCAACATLDAERDAVGRRRIMYSVSWPPFLNLLVEWRNSQIGRGVFCCSFLSCASCFLSALSSFVLLAAVALALSPCALAPDSLRGGAGGGELSHTLWNPYMWSCRTKEATFPCLK